MCYWFSHIKYSFICCSSVIYDICIRSRRGTDITDVGLDLLQIVRSGPEVVSIFLACLCIALRWTMYSSMYICMNQIGRGGEGGYWFLLICFKAVHNVGVSIDFLIDMFIYSLSAFLYFAGGAFKNWYQQLDRTSHRTYFN